jgi:galactofuranose transport system ATP-binding protein
VELHLCPEDRKAEGVVGDLTIRENIILALQARYGWFKFISPPKQYEITEKFIQLLGIVTPSPDQLVKNLSGGNQQKVILARWLATSPAGLDFG